MDCDSTPGKIRDFSLLHKHPGQFWGSASLLSMGYQEYSWSKAAWA